MAFEAANAKGGVRPEDQVHHGTTSSPDARLPNLKTFLREPTHRLLCAIGTGKHRGGDTCPCRKVTPPMIGSYAGQLGAFEGGG